MPAVFSPGYGNITVSYDFPGAAAQADFVIRSLSDDGVGLPVEVPNGGRSQPFKLAAEQYEIYRRVRLTVGSWTKDVACNRQTVNVTDGSKVDVRFEQPNAERVVATGQWPDLAANGLAGAFLTVHPIAEKILNQGDPDAYFDFEIDRDTVAATTCGPDGKFSLEQLPVGRYVVVLRAFRGPAPDGDGHSLPYSVGVNTFNVLGKDSGVHFFPNNFRIRPRWNTTQWSPKRVERLD